MPAPMRCQATRPAARRRCQVGWDRATRTFRGAIVELTGKAQEVMRWDADWISATTIYEVEAPTISALARELQGYANLEPQVRRNLLLDVPPHLREQVNA